MNAVLVIVIRWSQEVASGDPIIWTKETRKMM